MRIDHHLCDRSKPCLPIRVEKVVVREGEFILTLHQCCGYQGMWGGYRHTWSEVQQAISKHLNIKVITRRELRERLIGVRRFVAQDIKPICKNGCGSGEHDIFDRRDVRGLIGNIRRCSLCGRHGGDHEICIEKAVVQREKEFEKRWAGYEDLWQRQEDVKRIRLAAKVFKLAERMSVQLDREFTLKEVARMLPYHPNMNSMFRMCLTKKIEAKKFGRTWMITGRGVLSLIQKWIDTGRAPCRTRSGTRAMRKHDLTT